MIFGKERNKGLVLDGSELKVVEIGKDGVTENDILVHDAHNPDPGLHLMLVRLKNPLVTGIIRQVREETLEEREAKLTEEVKASSKIRSFDDLVS